MIRIAQQVGRGTWVSMGPLGWLLLSPFLLPVVLIWAVFVWPIQQAVILWRNVQRQRRRAAVHG